MKDENWIHSKLRESEDIIGKTDEVVNDLFKTKKIPRRIIRDRVPFTSEQYMNAIALALFTGRTQAFREVLELEEFDAVEIEGLQ